MRILHVDHSPVLGGAERSILELARAQREMGHDAQVAVGRAGPFCDALAAAGIPVTCLGWSRRFIDTAAEAGFVSLATGATGGLTAVVRLRRMISAVRPDVVHAHTRKAQLVTAAATIGSRACVVWHLRDDVPTRAITRSLLRVAISHADHAVALSHWLAHHYRVERFMPRSGILDWVPSGVDASVLRTLPTLWLDGVRAPIVGYVGQIAAWKAPHLLVDAAERLADRPDIRFAIVGDVWFRSGSEYGRWLEARVLASPARDRITVLATPSPVDAFAAIDILVHTSLGREPFGRVIVEAMAAHRPVIAFRQGAPRELLDDRSGTFTGSMDGAGLADAIVRVIDDPLATRSRVEVAAESAHKYEPAAVAQAMELAYARVVR